LNVVLDAPHAERKLGIMPIFARFDRRRPNEGRIAAMEAKDRLAHWQSIYAAKGERGVSWFQDSPQPSLALIEEVGDASSAVIDVGGGASRLAEALLQRGFRDVTVLDLSPSALAAAGARIGGGAERIQWIVADATAWEPPRAYDVWHDRAAFHFLVAEPDRAAYLSRLARAFRPGGHAIIATFAPDGPERCSGLPVMRYDADGIGRALGAAFRRVGTRRHEHVTPWGTPQQFQFSVFRHLPRPTA
jgi:SAM-dependent methyltransferase